MDYSVKNTTRKQREELVKKAFAISVSGADAPTEETTKLVREYIDGEKELHEVQRKVIEIYKKI